MKKKMRIVLCCSIASLSLFLTGCKTEELDLEVSSGISASFQEEVEMSTESISDRIDVQNTYHVLDTEELDLEVSSGSFASFQEEIETSTETILDTTDVQNTYHVLETDFLVKEYTKYGEIQEEHKDFFNQDNSVGFYYDMQCFYFDESYPEVLNQTLQNYYDNIREAYETYAENIVQDTAQDENIPYNSLIFQYITYVGEDYVSLVYNNVSYMGGVHPYSFLDGITIQCSTGELSDASDFVSELDEEIGVQLQKVLGFDVYSKEEWDFFLTEDSVVFFYYDLRFYDMVETKRVR